MREASGAGAGSRLVASLLGNRKFRSGGTGAVRVDAVGRDGAGAEPPRLGCRSHRDDEVSVELEAEEMHKTSPSCFTYGF